jgi:hypothetical protein
MYKKLEKYTEKLLYPGLLHRKLAARIFMKFGGNFFVYSAFPKSASQYLVALMAKAFEGRLKVIRAKSGPGLGHSFISEEKLFRDLHYRKDILLYGHIPCIYSNLRIIEKLTKTPKIIITIRPLADIVISYKEHIDKIGYGPIDYCTNDIPECHPEWHVLSDESKFDYLIQYVVPWYIRFVTGWQEAAKRIPIEFITFEEHTLFPKDCLRNIAGFFNMDMDYSEIDKLNTTDTLPGTNLNKGKAGRGFSQLKQRQLDRINEIVSLCGDRFCETFLGKYLVYGFRDLPLKPEDVIQRKRRSNQSLNQML